MSSMPDGATVLGMEVSRLQSNVTVDGDNVLHGTLHHIKNFDMYDQGATGNFAALHVVAPTDATVKITTSSVTDKPLDEDRTVVWKVTGTEDTLKVKVERGEESSDVDYKASGLTLEEE